MPALSLTKSAASAARLAVRISPDPVAFSLVADSLISFTISISMLGTF